MDLRVERSFNKQRGGWTFGLSGVPMEVLNPEAPLPPGPGESRIYPLLRTADGTDHRTMPVNGISGTDVWITQEFWRYTVATRTVELPNGWVARYSQDAGRAMLQEVEDPYGNKLGVVWEAYNPSDFTTRRPAEFTQTVGDETRRVTFLYDTLPSWATMPKTMTVMNGPEWTFEYDLDPYRLRTVSPPEGNEWVFDNSNGLTITLPWGGTIAYTFESQDFDGVPIQVVRERVTGGRDIQSGTWHFIYAPQTGESEGSTGEVSMPYNRLVKFTHQWSGLAQRWVLSSKVILEGEAERARFERQYKLLHIVDWATGPGTVPVPETETLSVDGHQYTTSFEYRSENFGDYHHPSKVTEAGELTRVTTRQFDYEFVPYLLNRIASESVTVGNETFTSSYDYQNETGFLERQVAYGIPTLFGRDNAGNRTTVTDARTHSTTFDYAWGVVQNTTTPEYAITRTINPRGTIASETRRGKKTAFEYRWRGSRHEGNASQGGRDRYGLRRRQRHVGESKLRRRVDDDRAGRVRSAERDIRSRVDLHGYPLRCRRT